MKDRARPIREHLREIRRRMMFTGVFFIGALVVAFIFYEQIFRILLVPAGDAINPSTGGKLIFTSVTEAWSTVAKVGVIAALVLTMPFLLFQVVMFLRPGLNPNERRMLYILLPAGIISFAAGVTFSYFVLLPPAIRFLLNFGSDLFTPFISATSYVSLIALLMFWMGLIFEIPIAMYFLARIGILRSRWLSRGRRWAYVIAFVLGAIITPTVDPVNQTLVAGPIIAMYEIGFWLTRFAEYMRARKAARLASGPA